MKSFYQISKSGEHSPLFLEVHVSYTVEVSNISLTVDLPLNSDFDGAVS